jgi:hypothetical protein
MSGTFERFDARLGRSYRLVLPSIHAWTAAGKATADSDIVEARFVELVPSIRVVQCVDLVSHDPANAGAMAMTWELTAVDAATPVGICPEHVSAGISARILRGALTC